MARISGLDAFRRTIDDARTALRDLDGRLGEVTFDPSDPESIEAAIRESERMIDERVSRHGGNPIIAPLVEQAKARFRQSIVDKAAAARLEPGGS
jgi:hypothetical protein